MNICEVQAVPDRMGFEQRGEPVGKTGGDVLESERVQGRRKLVERENERDTEMRGPPGES